MAITTFTQFVTSFVPSEAGLTLSIMTAMLAARADIVNTRMQSDFERMSPTVDLECPACLSAYRNCECGVLRVCPDCGDFLDYGCMCNEAREEFEAEMYEHPREYIDANHCFECGVSYRMDSPNCTDHHPF